MRRLGNRHGALIRGSRKGRLAAAAVGVAALLAACFAAESIAQRQIQQQLAAMPGSPADQPSSGGASVETATDAVGLIQRANNDMADGHVESAVRRLMYAAERFGTSLLELDSGVMVPTARYVDHVVGGWARERPAALATYRRLADAEAMGILGGPVERVRDPQKLERVVRRYLLSSVGDEAAYLLACHWIDHGRFAEAATLLQRLERVYPDPTVARREIVLRAALAHGRSGAIGKRDQELARLKRMGEAERTLSMIRSEARLRGSAAASPDGWPMTGGRPDGLGVMPPLAEASKEMPQELWAVLWSHRAPAPLSRMVENLQASIHQNFKLMTRSTPMMRRWRENLWRPTFEMASAGNVVCYSVAGVLHAFDAQTGRRMWAPVEHVERRRAEVGNANINYTSLRDGVDDWPTSIEEVFAFGDRVLSDLSIVGRTVYFLQPERGLGTGGRIHVAVNNQRVMLRELYKTNMLVAVDLSSGEVRWRRSVPAKHDPDDGRGPALTRVVVAPVPAGDRLLTLVEDSGDLVLVALSPEDGRVLYRRFLCSAPEGFAPNWSRVGLTVDGQAAFVSTNRGLVFAVDAGSGTIRWASRYSRKPMEQRRRGFGRSTIDWTGAQEWADGRVLPVGGQLLVTAADAPGVMIFDRFNGALLHKLEKIGPFALNEMDYIASATPTSVVFGGPEGLLAVDPDDLADAQFRKRWMRWYAPMPEGTIGRAAASADRLYVPTREGVVELERSTGRRLAVMPVSDRLDEPVGNLFLSDGHLFAGVGGRLAALGNARLQVARLSEAAVGGDVDALAARAQLLVQLGQTQQALEDLRREFELHSEPEGRADAAGRLIDVLVARAMASPDEAERPLEEAASVAQSRSQRLRVRLARAEVYVGRGDRGEAVRVYHEIAMTRAARPLTVAGDDDQWQVRPDVIGRQRLLGLVDDVSDGPTRDLLETLGRPELEAVLTEAEGRGEAAAGTLIDRLHRVASVHPGTAVSAEAIAALGAKLDDDGTFTRTEAALRALATEEPGPTGALAEAALAEAYARRQWHPAAKAGYLRAQGRLEAVAAKPAVEPDGEGAAATDSNAAEPSDPADAARADATRGMDAEDAADSFAASLPSAATMKQRAAAVGKRIRPAVDRPPFEKAWQIEKSQAQLLAFNGPAGGSVHNGMARNAVFFEGAGPWRESGGASGPTPLAYGWLARHALVYVPGSERITAYAARSGEMRWAAPLPRDVENQVQRHGYQRRFAGGYDGHILIMASPSRSLAIDLVTGKRIWTEDRDRAAGAARRSYHASSRYDGFRGHGRLTSVGAGVVAEAVNVDGGNVLIARDTATGQVRWRRSFDSVLAGVEIVDHNRVGVLLDDGGRAAVFDLQTGRRLRQFDLPMERPGRTWRMWTAHGLLTQSSQRRIEVQPLAAGAQRWTYEPKGRLIMRSWQRLGRDRVLILWHNRTLTMLNLKTREADFEVAANKIVQSMFDAALSPDGEQLLIAGNAGSNLALALLDVDSGKLESKVNAGRLRNYLSVSVGMFRRTGRLLPAMVAKGNRNDFELQLFDMATGEALVDESPEFESPVAAPALRDGVVLITTREGLVAMSGESGAESEDAAARQAPPRRELAEQADEDAADADAPAAEANAAGISIKSQKGLIEVRAQGRVVQIKAGRGAKVRFEGGKLIVNDRVVPLERMEPEAAED